MSTCPHLLKRIFYFQKPLVCVNTEVGSKTGCNGLDGAEPPRLQEGSGLQARPCQGRSEPASPGQEAAPAAQGSGHFLHPLHSAQPSILG